jgi:ribose 1,5-bisphosphokinase PhnN
MQRGWEEAGKIRRLLIRAGNFRSRDMKIIAVGMSGALEAYVSEYKVKINADKVSLRKAIRHILRRKIK